MQAQSIYGDNKKNFYNIHSKIEPQSPYGVSKAAAYWLIKIYRENIIFIAVQESYLIMSPSKI